MPEKYCKNCRFYGFEKMSTIIFERKRKFLKPVCDLHKERGWGSKVPKDADEEHSCNNFEYANNTN